MIAIYIIMWCIAAILVILTAELLCLVLPEIVERVCELRDTILDFINGRANR